MLTYQVSRIICLGVGSVQSSVSSQCQLSFLALTVEWLRVPSSAVWVIDPVFTAIDMLVIRDKFGFNAVSDQTQLVERPLITHNTHPA